MDISGRDDAVAGPSGGATIAPNIDYEENDGDLEDHQSNVTPFSAVLAPNTSNTTMLELDQAAALRQMGVVLTNEVYDGVRIPDQHDEQQEIRESRKTFLKKPAVRLAGLLITMAA